MNMQFASVGHAEHTLLKSHVQTQWFKGAISTAMYTKAYTCSSSCAGFLMNVNMQSGPVDHAEHTLLKSHVQTLWFKGAISTARYTKVYTCIAGPTKAQAGRPENAPTRPLTSNKAYKCRGRGCKAGCGLTSHPSAVLMIHMSCYVWLA